MTASSVLALVLQIALGRLDQVGDQVVSPLELDINLREGVLEAVPQRHQAVILADGVKDRDNRDQHHDTQKNSYKKHSGPLV